MTNTNTLYPNIKQIADHIRGYAGENPCENCGNPKTKPYVFAYGKKLSEESSTVTEGTTTKTTTTTTFGDLNAMPVFYCENCVAQHRKKMKNKTRAYIFILGLISIALILTVILMPGEQITLTIFATILPMVVLFFIVKLSIINSSPDLPGLDMALKSKMETLKQAGYDQFWKDPENPDRIV